MRLKSVTLKGFKSFSERTRLDFGPGVSVVVGPNGSGKSNVTDAVLWAMGEQSPLAVRGSSMQDVIFGGGRGVKARSHAEVEIVLDNSDGTVDLPLSEISILRRLDRSGEGEYRLNGARCRLVDVIEVLSDTGLGKETHSVISQGRVEAIVTSKPKDRRLLIEEAAGLGKHRKRRRRAQLKLERTQENLDRALDVEREARTRLRPLKRQAEAAELHQRLRQQTLETRMALALDTLLARREQLVAAESVVGQSRAERELIERRLGAVVERRGQAERAFAERAEAREQLSRKVYGARSALERVRMRLELTQTTSDTLAQRIARTEVELQTLTSAAEHAGAEQAHAGAEQRIVELEAQLSELDAQREQELRRELAELAQEHEQAAVRAQELAQRVLQAQHSVRSTQSQLEEARALLAQADRELQRARRDAANVGAELAAVNQFLRSHSSSGQLTAAQAPTMLSDALQVTPGYELALAAVLGARLDAAVVGDLPAAQALLNSAGPDGATVLLSSDFSPSPHRPSSPPLDGARALADLIRGPQELTLLAGRLLADAWVVEDLDGLTDDFQGIAVTRTGRVYFAASGEVRQIGEGGSERVLARRNERDRLIAQSEQAVQAEHAAVQIVQDALSRVAEHEGALEAAHRVARDIERARAEAQESERSAQWLLGRRREMPEQGPQAVRRAQLEGELAAERRQVERVAREAQERSVRIENLRSRLLADQQLHPAAQRLAAILEQLQELLAARTAELEELLSTDKQAGEQTAQELRCCAAEEAEIQALLRARGENVTQAEIAAQRLRDQNADAQLELQTVTEELELQPPDIDAAERLDPQEVQSLSARLERLARRREQIGPVNPLAAQEYAEAIAHVEELEGRRNDLETALRELRTLIRDTDRQIHDTFQETFQAAARNFEQLVGDVFPGGSGRLRLVDDERTPPPVLGGQQLNEGGETGAPDSEAEPEQDGEELSGEELMGVEIEVTPAGKSTKRLSLLSGGEKSMTALAFLFAVFLARPCPFYILDEVEAALDDLNLDRFLTLLRRYAGRAQFIVITHQKRTMEAADWLYGVSMGGDGVSKVISRRLPPAEVNVDSEQTAA